MIDILIQYFKQYFPLNKVERDALEQHFSARKVKRRGFILQQGEVCRYFYFVVEGCCKMYGTDKNGKEYNIEFAMEHDWITDLSSFYAKKPSQVYIEAIEPVALLQVDREGLIKLYTEHPKFDKNFRIIIEKKYIALQDRLLQSISLTAEERYQLFLEEQPALANRLPNTQIASYLGITPEFLSKIRKDIAGKS